MQGRSNAFHPSAQKLALESNINSWSTEISGNSPITYISDLLSLSWIKGLFWEH